MEQSWFIHLLFTGFVPLVLSIDRKYFLIQQGKTWSDAQAYCRAVHTDLAMIKTNEDLIQIQTEAQTKLFSASAWIGMYNDVNSWRWSMGNEPMGGLSPWVPGNPNNNGGHQECGSISPSYWADTDCAVIYSFVCYDDTLTGNQRYIYIITELSWHDAQAYCRQYHTDLASSRDATENSIIMGLLSTWSWFGLFRDSWKWIDQTNFSTLSWMPGQPDNALDNENCGYLDNTQVADTPCTDLMPFFCYEDVTVQQIVRVNVLSSEDVNDPAVKVTILDQINQKLKNSGLGGNFTIKWRQQSDGVMFQRINDKPTVANKMCEMYTF